MQKILIQAHHKAVFFGLLKKGIEKLAKNLAGIFRFLYIAAILIISSVGLCPYRMDMLGQEEPVL